jgi:hypothetical protein
LYCRFHFAVSNQGVLPQGGFRLFAVPQRSGFRHGQSRQGIALFAPQLLSNLVLQLYVIK